VSGHTQPRAFTLRAQYTNTARPIPEWIVLATPEAAAPPEDVHVIELEPVLNLVSALADALECSEDQQDPLHDAADEVLLGEADELLRRNGRER
jgi:hypothetical protein